MVTLVGGIPIGLSLRFTCEVSVPPKRDKSKKCANVIIVVASTLWNGKQIYRGRMESANKYCRRDCHQTELSALSYRVWSIIERDQRTLWELLLVFRVPPRRRTRCVWECEEDEEKVNYGSRSPLLFFPLSTNRLPDGGREFPFSFMLTVSSLREIHPPMMDCDSITYAMRSDWLELIAKQRKKLPKGNNIKHWLRENPKSKKLFECPQLFSHFSSTHRSISDRTAHHW